MLVGVARNRVEAAGAEELEFGGDAGAQAYVVDDVAGAAVLFDAVGDAGDVQRAGLPDVGGVVDDAGCDGFVELERVGCEVSGRDKHCSLSIAQIPGGDMGIHSGSIAGS